MNGFIKTQTTSSKYIHTHQNICHPLQVSYPLLSIWIQQLTLLTILKDLAGVLGCHHCKPHVQVRWLHPYLLHMSWTNKWMAVLCPQVYTGINLMTFVYWIYYYVIHIVVYIYDPSKYTVNWGCTYRGYRLMYIIVCTTYIVWWVCNRQTLCNNYHRAMHTWFIITLYVCIYVICIYG